MLFLKTHTTVLLFPLLFFLIPSRVSAWTDADTRRVLKKMEAVYAGVTDYQTHLEMMSREKDGSFQTKKILYTFKKPNRIRLDFESPNPGTVLVYPDRNGKAVIQPSGWARFFKLRLAPDNFLLKVSPGQRIDQTDIGRLIRNISLSLTTWRRGEVVAEEDNRHLRLRILSRNHFLKERDTLYLFLIDRKLWLPVGVEESTPEGIQERVVSFGDLRINIGVPDHYFQIAGK